MRLVAPEVGAGAAPARLHLVGDEEDAVLAEHLLEGAEQPVGRHGEPGHPLYRLGHEAGHVACRAAVDHVAQVGDAGCDVLPVGQVPEGAAVAVGAVHVADVDRGEARRRPVADARGGHRGEGAAVVAVADGQHLVGPAGRAAQHERRLVGLRPGIDEEHLGVWDARQRRDPLGQLDHRADEVEGGAVRQSIRRRYDAHASSTTSGTEWPVIVVRMPPKKSRYSRPSRSRTVRPSPETISIGSS